MSGLSAIILISSCTKLTIYWVQYPFHIDYQLYVNSLQILLTLFCGVECHMAAYKYTEGILHQLVLGVWTGLHPILEPGGGSFEPTHLGLVRNPFQSRQSIQMVIPCMEQSLLRIKLGFRLRNTRQGINIGTSFY